MPTIIALPLPIKQAVAALLAEHGTDAWMKRAQALHLRYTQQAQDKEQMHIADYGDAVAYLGLRASATYAQIYGALDAVREIMPSLGSHRQCLTWAAAPAVVCGRFLRFSPP